MTSEGHSSGSYFVGNPGKCAVKVDVFRVVFPPINIAVFRVRDFRLN